MVNTATSKMIQNLQTNTGLDYVEITWDRPMHDPIKYELTYSCRLQKGEEYITNQPETLPSTSNSVRLSQLLQDSICKLNILAVYNPASIDPGISVTESTSKEGAYKC